MINSYKKETHDVKYVRELLEYFDAYGVALIDEIYIGVGIALGLEEKKARTLARRNPNVLQKAFFKDMFNRFKAIFKHKVPRFVLKQRMVGPNNKPMTPAEWQKFNDAIDKYWRDNADHVIEDIAVKGFMLGRNTTQFRRENKKYNNNSLGQINFDQYDGKMPETITEAYKSYDFDNAEKNALNKTWSRVAMHVQETNNEIKEAIRKQVQTGIEGNKGPSMIASDLYWGVQKDKDLINQYTAERVKRNWNRVAVTEGAMLYEAGILAPHESDAMESLKDERKAKYFIFTGGTCPWCVDHHGTLVRLVPASIVVDTSDDSLKSMGINDPNTDIAIWVGKNNVGYKENKSVHQWRVCTPAHPHNVATFVPIDLEKEVYNPKTDRVEHRHKEYKFVPPMKDYTVENTKEEEFRNPVFIGDNLVRRGHNVYQSVDHAEYDKRLKEYEKDSTLPIPVDRDSTGYRYIFGEAEKNR